MIPEELFCGEVMSKLGPQALGRCACLNRAYNGSSKEVLYKNRKWLVQIDPHKNVLWMYDVHTGEELRVPIQVPGGKMDTDALKPLKPQCSFAGLVLLRLGHVHDYALILGEPLQNKWERLPPPPFSNSSVTKACFSDDGKLLLASNYLYDCTAIYNFEDKLWSRPSQLCSYLASSGIVWFKDAFYAIADDHLFYLLLYRHEDGEWNLVYNLGEEVPDDFGFNFMRLVVSHDGDKLLFRHIGSNHELRMFQVQPDTREVLPCLSLEQELEPDLKHVHLNVFSGGDENTYFWVIKGDMVGVFFKQEGVWCWKNLCFEPRPDNNNVDNVVQTQCKLFFHISCRSDTAMLLLSSLR